ncbi:hypothetical protein WDW86_05315, partial [Bdellovibrionota bacterium FG-2]
VFLAAIASITALIRSSSLRDVAFLDMGFLLEKETSANCGKSSDQIRPAWCLTPLTRAPM